MSQNNLKLCAFILKAFKKKKILNGIKTSGQTKNPQAKHRLRCFGIMGGHDLFF
jgi:hypothetical protein